MAQGLELAVLALGAGQLHLLTASVADAVPADPGQLRLLLEDLDDPFHPLRPRQTRLPGRLALVDVEEAEGGEGWTQLALVPPSGFVTLDPFTLEEAWQALREPGDLRALLRELLDALALESGVTLRPSATALTVILPAGAPLPLRGALRDVLDEAGYRWSALVYPPEASALWRGIAADGSAAGPLVARVVGERGPAEVPARVSIDDRRLRVGLGHAAGAGAGRAEAALFEWEPTAGELLRGGLLLAALGTLAGREVHVDRSWHFALSADGATAHRLTLAEVEPGRRVGLVALELEPPAYDPPLVLHAGLAPGLPLSAMARCGALRVGKHRLADNAQQLVGRVEWIAGEGVRWGWQLPLTGEQQHAALARELFV